MLLTLSEADITALFISIKLSLVTTLLLVPLALPIAWQLSRLEGMTAVLSKSLLALPALLPASVFGLLLFLSFAPGGWIGRFWFFLTHSSISYSFAGLVMASIIASLPFAVFPLLKPFSHINREWLATIASLGASPVRIRYGVILSMNRFAMITSASLTAANTIGGFCLLVMIGGSIPGETLTAPISVFQYFSKNQYDAAYGLTLVLTIICLALLLLALWAYQRCWSHSQPSVLGGHAE